MLQHKKTEPDAHPNALVKNVTHSHSERIQLVDMDKVQKQYEPFVSVGYVSLPDSDEARKVKVLRDTGASQSLILESALSFCDKSSVGASVILQGVEGGYVNAPLHEVDLKSDLVSGIVKVGVRPSLPVKDVSFILGNDLAGERVVPSPVVSARPCESDETNRFVEEFPHVFPAYAVTRSMTKNAESSVQTWSDKDVSGDVDSSFEAVGKDNEVHDGMPECPQVSHAEIKYDMDQVRVIMPDACVLVTDDVHFEVVGEILVPSTDELCAVAQELTFNVSASVCDVVICADAQVRISGEISSSWDVQVSLVDDSQDKDEMKSQVIVEKFLVEVVQRSQLTAEEDNVASEWGTRAPTNPRGADEVLVADLLAATNSPSEGTDVEETADVAALGRAEIDCSGSEVASVHQCHVEDYMTSSIIMETTPFQAGNSSDVLQEKDEGTLEESTPRDSEVCAEDCADDHRHETMMFQAENSLGYLWKEPEMKATETDVVDSDVECWLGERFTLPCKRARHGRYAGRVQDINHLNSERNFKKRKKF